MLNQSLTLLHVAPPPYFLFPTHCRLVINVPPVGTTGVIRGVVSGTLQVPSVYSAVAFTQDASSNWWGPKASAVPRSDGYFEISNWAQSSGDVSAPNIGVYLMPAGMTVPLVAGTQLPPNVMSAQVATAVQSRSDTQPTLPQPVPWAAPTTTGVPQPPAAGGGAGGGGTTTGGGGAGADLPSTPGPLTGPSGGRIQFAGYSWIVKDSAGGAVGPGPNVFVGTSE